MAPFLSLHGLAAARALDAAASARIDGGAYALMERAGRAAWQFLAQRWPDARRITVVCGPGNNGGDGYVLARLARRARRQVCVVHLDEHVPRTPLAQRACTAWLGEGGRVALFPDELPPADVVVDALFGIGLARAPQGDAQALVEAINAQPAPVLALDVPSGVDAGSGAVPGAAVRAHATVQFLQRHAGLYTGAALDHVGEAALDTLDIADELLAAQPADAHLLDASMLGHWLRPRLRDSHKGNAGHVLCIGGDRGHGGAILLAAEAALRSGAGLVSVATRAAHVAPLLARRPEAMAHAVESGEDLAPLLQAASVVAIGPGLGQDAWGQAMLRLALRAGRPLVLDADALNLLASAPQPLDDAILTPHPGEAARLLGRDTAQVQADRFAAVAALAQLAPAAILKGAGSLVAAAGQPPRVLDAGNPGMASGGMGDVLTGVVAALRAQGLAPFEAASAGALLHSAAGDAAAAGLGERGLLASDLFAPLQRMANPETA
ncbi:MAG: NAD(P)H-hydrate dehydratase [Pseudoxanthomonas sp.]